MKVTMMAQYEVKAGDVSIFENEKGGNDKAPDARGYVIAHRDIKAGERLEISLWTGREGSARIYGGKISDMREKKEGAHQATSYSKPKPINNDVPFDDFDQVPF